MWDLFAQCNQNVFFPSVKDVWLVMISDFYQLMLCLQDTFIQAMFGLIVGIVISYVLAFLMYRFNFMYHCIHPLIILSQCVPAIAFAPIFAVSFGYGNASKVILVALSCFFPLTISLINGFRDIDVDEINLLRTMRASKWQIFWHVVLPESRTYFFSGLKVSVSYSMVSAVVAEWMGGTSGLGVYMIQAKKSYSLDKLFASVFVVCVVSCALILVVFILEKIKLKKIKCLWTSLCMLGILGILILLVSNMFTRNSVSQLTKVNLALDYTPNTNHTGIYVAKKLGFFEQEGLDVNIILPSEDTSAMLVSSGASQFGIDFQDQLAALFDSSDNPNVQVVATILQHNISGILSLEKSNITSFSDLEYKTYATLDNFVEQGIIRHCMQLANAKFEKLHLVHSCGVDLITALHTGIDAVWSYDAWDNVALKLKEINYNFMYFKDVDPVLDYYTPVVICQKDFADTHDDVVRRFLCALSRGYAFAREDVSTSADILLEYAGELDASLVKASQEIISQEYFSEIPVWGEIDKNRWNNFYKWLHEKEITSNDLSQRKELFTNAFLPKYH